MGRQTSIGIESIQQIASPPSTFDAILSRIVSHKVDVVLRLSLYWRLEIRLGILSLYSESLMKRLLSLSIPMATDVRFKAITSISDNLGTRRGRGIFAFSCMRLSPNSLQIGR